ncbi:MAG: 26S protease regulatory subunit [candidate division NC10 bacterium]|nr:26S protease regulatory subunit [candidate division NC10 bacterium]
MEKGGRGGEVFLRKLEDLTMRLEKRFGDLRGKMEMVPSPEAPLEDIGGLGAAKREIQGLSFALRNPELHQRWGTTPPKGILLYGPPGTGKTLLAKALASLAQTVFYHLRIPNIISKWHADSGEVIQEVFALVKEAGRGILFLDEVDALALDRGSEETRGASRRLVNTILENLDELKAYDQILVVASTNRPDAVDPALISPGRIDRLIEVPLPGSEDKRQILEIHQRKAERIAGRRLFQGLDYDSILARTVKMTGSDLAEVIRRTLEEKVRLEGSGGPAELVTTEDILREIENYRRIKEVVEKIRYGQYL